MDGDVLLSTATSPQDRLVVGLKCVGDSASNSPKQNNNKKCCGTYEGSLWFWSLGRGVVDQGEHLDGYG